jgi:hypothetical protein
MFVIIHSEQISKSKGMSISSVFGPYESLTMAKEEQIRIERERYGHGSCVVRKMWYPYGSKHNKSE